MGRKPLRLHLFSILPLLCLIWSCNQELVPSAPNPGIIDIQAYRALGDGFSAGFANTGLDPLASQGLYAEAQLTAWPLLMATQFGLSPDYFQQHLAQDVGSGYEVLTELYKPDNCSASTPVPVLTTVDPNASWTREGQTEVQYHNLSLPHLRMEWTASDSFGRNNPFFQRMPQPVQPNYLSMVEAQDFRFFTLWLGTEDVLDYAMTGSALPVFRPLSKAGFAEKFATLLSRTVEGLPSNRHGVVGNIPDVTRFPYFTRMGHVYEQWENCAYAQKRIYIQTDEPGQPVRVAEAEDLVLMEVQSQLGALDSAGIPFGLSPDAPLSDKQVLTASERMEVQAIIKSYNDAIDSVITAYNTELVFPKVALANLNILFDEVCSGQIEDGLDVSGSYLSGGVFSLDGLYLTARGNALVANAYIEAINAFEPFRALIPPIDITTHKGVVYP